MFSRFAGIGIDHGTQYRIQTMDGITGGGNTSENATFPVADGEDEGDNMFHAGQGTDSDNGHDGDNDGESDSESMSFDDNDSELDDWRRWWWWRRMNQVLSSKHLYAHYSNTY